MLNRDVGKCISNKNTISVASDHFHNFSVSFSPFTDDRSDKKYHFARRSLFPLVTFITMFTDIFWIHNCPGSPRLTKYKIIEASINIYDRGGGWHWHCIVKTSQTIITFGSTKEASWSILRIPKIYQCKTFTIHFMTAKNCILSFVAFLVSFLQAGT